VHRGERRLRSGWNPLDHDRLDDHCPNHDCLDDDRPNHDVLHDDHDRAERFDHHDHGARR
jgi:hypothetical protein